MLHHWQIILASSWGTIALFQSIGFWYEHRGARRDRAKYPAPGQMIKVGRHALHLYRLGSAAGPTVVIEQGAGELSRFWWPLQEQIAKFARVCTYDRAGYAWSESVRSARSIEDRAQELHVLLSRAKVPAPYVFVAHSYGGLIVRSYQRAYPSQVAGLVFVDTPEQRSIFNPAVLDFYSRVRIMNRVAAEFARFGLLRLMRRWWPLEKYGFWLSSPQEYIALCDDLQSIQTAKESSRRADAPLALGALPVTVITHGKPFPGPFAVLEKNWTEGQLRLAALSSASRLIVATKSNHMIQQDEPELVLQAIKELLEGCRALPAPILDVL